MKNQNVFKFLAPALAVALLLVSTHALGQTPRPSIADLINSCQMELQTLCNRMNEPREAVICLRENEPQLYTRKCIQVMKQMNRARNNIPLPSEEPYRVPYENNQVQ
jgi:hypothetical protein